jgi:hypothetical protein
MIVSRFAWVIALVLERFFLPDFTLRIKMWKKKEKYRVCGMIDPLQSLAG